MATITLKIGATSATLNNCPVNMNKEKDRKDVALAFKAELLRRISKK